MAKHTIGEEWRPVVGCEGRYEVSSRGKVRSVAVDGTRLQGKEIKPYTNQRGYLRMDLYLSRGPFKRVSVHTLIAEAFIGPRPAGYQCNHKNGIKTDNRPENLEWVTPSQNTTHAFRELGIKSCCGSSHADAKLTEKLVSEIRQQHAEGAKQNVLALKYGVSRASLWKVIRRKTWKHVA